jgi:hypothetical protein
MKTFFFFGNFFRISGLFFTGNIDLRNRNLFSGQPMAGMMVALAATLSVLSGDGTVKTVRKEATGYFASAIGATVLCISAFVLFLRLPITKYYLDCKKNYSGKIEQVDRVTFSCFQN